MPLRCLIRHLLSLVTLAGMGLCFWQMSAAWDHMGGDVSQSPDLWSLNYEGCLVVLDAGHGGHDGGTQGFGILEKNLALAITLKVEKHLKAAGIPVLLTRSTDTFVELGERCEIASRNDATVFLSIHLNADADSAETAGVETYYSSHKPFNEIAALKRSLGLPPDAPLRDGRSERLARMVQKAAIAALHTPDRGARDSNYLVVVNTRCAAALLECGYLTNGDDCKKLQQASVQEELAAATAGAVRQYLSTILMNPARGLILADTSGAVPAPDSSSPSVGPPAPASARTGQP